MATEQEVVSVLSQLAADPDLLSRVVARAPDALNRLSGAFSKVTEAAEKFATEMFNIQIGDLSSKFGNLSENVGEYDEAITRGAYGLTHFLSVFGKADAAFAGFEKRVNAGNDFAKAWDTASPIFTKLTKSLVLIGPGLNKLVTGMVAGADATISFENQMISLYASSGQLDEVFGGTGFTIERLNDVTSEMYETFDSVATSSNMLSSEVAKFGETLAKIPGIWGSIDVAGQKGNVTLGAFDAIMKVARGTGLDYADAVKLTDDAFMKLGSSAERSVELIAQIGAVSQATNLRLEVVRGAADEFAGSFQLIGDNMDGALTILGQFGEALHGKLGQNAISGIARGYVKGLTEMSLAQKSFISSASGGKGGLAGGLEIELMLREGNIQGVQRMAEEAIRKQFGKIVTLDEAAGNEEMAGQFQMQRQMVQDFGLASDPNAAGRILDAMAAGVSQIEMPTTDEAVAGAIQSGEQIQQAQYNELINFHNDMNKGLRERSRRDREGLQGILGMIGGNAGERAIQQRARGIVEPNFEQGRDRAAQTAVGKVMGMADTGAAIAKGIAGYIRPILEANMEEGEKRNTALASIDAFIKPKEDEEGSQEPKIPGPAGTSRRRMAPAIAPSAAQGAPGAAQGAPGPGANYFIVPADAVVRIEIDMGDGIRQQADIAARGLFGQAVSGEGG